jgi:hypothetical protein
MYFIDDGDTAAVPRSRILLSTGESAAKQEKKVGVGIQLRPDGIRAKLGSFA